jgi:hypothetical protein
MAGTGGSVGVLVLLDMDKVTVQVGISSVIGVPLVRLVLWAFSLCQRR